MPLQRLGVWPWDLDRCAPHQKWKAEAYLPGLHRRVPQSKWAAEVNLVGWQGYSQVCPGVVRAGPYCWWPLELSRRWPVRGLTRGQKLGPEKELVEPRRGAEILLARTEMVPEE